MSNLFRKSLREECGVFGVFGHQEAANLTYLGLYALQHRGQEACGIVTLSDKNQFHSHKSFGIVAEGFKKETLDKLVGSSGVGHVRYSTHGDSRLVENIQPFSFKTSKGLIAIAHNGNLTNAKQQRSMLEERGSIFQSSSDTEIFMHLLAKSKKDDFKDQIIEVMNQVKGAYSLVILTAKRMYAVRDTFGFRPLCLGRLQDAVIIASESCAFDLIGADYLREVEPGEVVEISTQGIKSSKPFSRRETAFCAFEPIYFSRPDSKLNGHEVYEYRKALGVELAKETHIDADLIVPVPDSGVAMALGYAAETKLPLELGLVRNHYVGRTFIEPAQSIRDFGVKIKLNPLPATLKGKRVIVIDDSLVRGTTSVKIIRMIRQAGAKEIHFRIASPPITHSCYFGVDTPKRQNLLAANKTCEEIREFVGADTLAFLSEQGLKNALSHNSKNHYCLGCFNGEYPEDICEDIVRHATDQAGPGLKAGF